MFIWRQQGSFVTINRLVITHEQIGHISNYLARKSWVFQVLGNKK